MPFAHLYFCIASVTIHSCSSFVKCEWGLFVWTTKFQNYVTNNLFLFCSVQMFAKPLISGKALTYFHFTYSFKIVIIHIWYNRCISQHLALSFDSPSFSPQFQPSLQEKPNKETFYFCLLWKVICQNVKLLLKAKFISEGIWCNLSYISLWNNLAYYH